MHPRLETESNEDRYLNAQQTILEPPQQLYVDANNGNLLHMGIGKDYLLVACKLWEGEKTL